MTSNKTIRTSILLASLLAAGAAFAQAPAQPKGDATDNKVSNLSKTSPAANSMSDKTRADVKAEAVASNKNTVGTPVNKSGEGVDKAANPYPAGEPKTRAEVRAEAGRPVGAKVNKSGEPNSKTKATQADASNTTTGPMDTPATRADVKAEAKAANKQQ